MGRYNVRDILGHWVKPRSRQGDACPHACCRGRRVHPANLPVMLKPRLLRQLPERTLVEHMERHPDERVVTQTLGEIDRRERAAAARKHRRFVRVTEREELLEYEMQRASHATRGNMVNAAGVAAGVNERDLMTGREDRAVRYATPELRRYWEDHPRPSAGLMSANPATVRRARAGSNMGRSAPTPRRPRGRGRDRRTEVYQGIY
jgi:hypothetical protein